MHEGVKDEPGQLTKEQENQLKKWNDKCVELGQGLINHDQFLRWAYIDQIQNCINVRGQRIRRELLAGHLKPRREIWATLLTERASSVDELSPLAKETIEFTETQLALREYTDKNSRIEKKRTNGLVVVSVHVWNMEAPNEVELTKKIAKMKKRPARWGWQTAGKKSRRPTA